MASYTDPPLPRPRASTSNSQSAPVTLSASTTATTTSRSPDRSGTAGVGTSSISHRPTAAPDNSRQPAGDAGTSAPVRDHRRYNRVDQHDSDASDIADDDKHLWSTYDAEFARLFTKVKKVTMAFVQTERIQEK